MGHCYRTNRKRPTRATMAVSLTRTLRALGAGQQCNVAFKGRCPPLTCRCHTRGDSGFEGHGQEEQAQLRLTVEQRRKVRRVSTMREEGMEERRWEQARCALEALCSAVMDNVWMVRKVVTDGCDRRW